MISVPLHVATSDISSAWKQIFLTLMKPGVESIAPLTVVMAPSVLNDGSDVREAIDTILEARGKSKIDTVSNTIFPVNLWNQTLGRDVLFRRYIEIAPRLLSVRQNRYGTYFHRLVSYEANNGARINQLEQIIQTYQHGNHRSSALVASVFDPRKDHTNQPVRGFPCLQHVQFIVDNKQKTLTVTGIYANQYIFDKAYGNYLGLQNLGIFMAHELGLVFRGTTCIAALAHLGNFTKGELQNLAKNLSEEVRLSR